MSGTSFKPATRVEKLGLSQIVRISEHASRLRAAGLDVLSFATGEPDFPTPDHVIEAAGFAASTGETFYPPTQGSMKLRESVAKAYERDSGIEVDTRNILISTGAKQVLFNALLATLNPGDEVIVSAPYWSSYADIVSVAGGRLITISACVSSDLKLQADDLRRSITPKTRWLILNSPCNPSGGIYSRDELSEIGLVLRECQHIWVISDEIYQHISYLPFTSFSEAVPELKERCLTVNGVSKAYAMTGWRIGWGIGPAELIEAMVAIQGQSTSGASSISQAAAIAALDGPQELLEDRLNTLRQRRDFAAEALNAINGIYCLPPAGSFYLFPSCEALFGRITPTGTLIDTDIALCEYLLKSAGVALIPGCAFGTPGHFRLSFACSTSDLKTGCKRIATAISNLK